MPKRQELNPIVSDEDSTSNHAKAELQERMDEARESISQTVEQIKGTVGDQVDAVKETVGGVLSLRQGFQRDPLVWSLGALSAGFALGYTLGYANKHTKSHGQLPTPLAAFVDDLARELSKVGKDLVLPSLDAEIKVLFGFDLSSMFQEIGDQPPRRSRSSSKTRVRRSARKKKTKRRR